MKKIGPPWCTSLIVSGLSFFVFVWCILLSDICTNCCINEWFHKILQSSSLFLGIYSNIRNMFFSLVEQEANVNGRTFAGYIPIIGCLFFLGQFGIVKRDKLQYSFLSMYSFFFEELHPKINIKKVGHLCIFFYVLSLLTFFISIYYKDFPPIVLSFGNIIMLQLNGFNNMRKVKKWKKTLYYEQKEKNSTKEE